MFFFSQRWLYQFLINSACIIYSFIYFYNLNTKNINNGMHCLFLTVRIQQSLGNQHVHNSKQLSKCQYILIRYNIPSTSVTCCHSLKWSMAWLRSTPEEGREERQPAWLWCESPYKAARRGNCQRGTDVRAENLSHSTTSLGNSCTSKWNSSDTFSIVTDFFKLKNTTKMTQFNLTWMY